MTKLRVLVIEDDRSVRETLGLVLETYGYDVELVADGPSTFTSLQKRWPDVMLLDLALEEMSGEELHAMILQRFGRVPSTLVLSASQEGAQRTLQLKGATFLAKPYSIEQLVTALEQAAFASSDGQISSSA